MRLLLGLPLALFGAFVFFIGAVLGAPFVVPIGLLYIFTGACVILTRRPIPIAISVVAGLVLASMAFALNSFPLPTK